MIRFDCDYSEGAHPQILEALSATNLMQTPGYGLDEYSENARALIRGACRAAGADVHFLVGGTQVNIVMLASILRPHQGAVSAHSGHIAVHETGAIEAAGHKVLTISSHDGKLTAEGVNRLYRAHWDDESREHAVQPGLVYISHPTETGTTYSKAELAALSGQCRELSLPLVMDGARLGYGLASEGNDLNLPDIAALCDMFSIGGTKLGALFGEAVVICNDALKRDFRYHIKQRGGLLAKGRLLGLQFQSLFSNGLYQSGSAHAVTQAMRIRAAFEQKGIRLRYDSGTNQQFPVLSYDMQKALAAKFVFSHWEDCEAGEAVVRFCTSWATPVEHVDLLCESIAAL